jgi:hypothetical protein
MRCLFEGSAYLACMMSRPLRGEGQPRWRDARASSEACPSLLEARSCLAQGTSSSIAGLVMTPTRSHHHPTRPRDHPRGPRRTSDEASRSSAWASSYLGRGLAIIRVGLVIPRTRPRDHPRGPRRTSSRPRDHPHGPRHTSAEASRSSGWASRYLGRGLAFIRVGLVVPRRGLALTHHLLEPPSVPRSLARATRVSLSKLHPPSGACATRVPPPRLRGGGWGRSFALRND